MARYKKHKKYSIEERNQLVLLYLDRHMSSYQIIRENDIASRSVFYRWVKQYREFGTCVDGRGKATREQAPNKGRPRKYKENLEELSKEQLIERVKMYQDIKKSMAYLIDQQQNSNIKS